MLDIPETDFWDELSEEVKQTINDAKDQMDRGEGMPHDEVMARMKQRFLNNSL